MSAADVKECRRRAEAAEADAARLRQRIRAWVRHGKAVPADVTTYDREIVNAELLAIIEERTS